VHTAAVSHPRSAANTHKGGQDAETPCLARARGLRQTSAHTCDREQACGAVCTACKHAHRTIRRHMTPHTTWHILPPRGVYPGDWMEFQEMVLASLYRTSCCCCSSLLLLLCCCCRSRRTAQMVRSLVLLSKVACVDAHGVRVLQTKDLSRATQARHARTPPRDPWFSDCSVALRYRPGTHGRGCFRCWCAGVTSPPRALRASQGQNRGTPSQEFSV
jgi:hypothetical protein